MDIAVASRSTSDVERVALLGREIMGNTWDKISAEIDALVQDELSARDIKKQLASHAWCGLLIALTKWIEQIDKAVQALSDQGKTFVKALVTTHLSGLSRTLAEAVADIMVDKVWSALSRLVHAHFPVTGDDSLRVLRILALFACPAVDRHPEVYEHAAWPLMADARALISDEVRDSITTLFDAWWSRRVPGGA